MNFKERLACQPVQTPKYFFFLGTEATVLLEERFMRLRTIHIKSKQNKKQLKWITQEKGHLLLTYYFNPQITILPSQQ